MTLLFSVIGFSQVSKDSVAIEKLLVQAKNEQGEYKYDETYRILLEALNLAQKKKYKALEFKTEIAIANMHLMKSDINQAKVFFENKFPDPSFPKDIESYYYHRKTFYYNQIPDHEAALAMAKKGVKIAQENNLTNDLIMLYNEIGYTYEHQNNFSLSEEYYDKVLALTKNDLRTYSNAFVNKARLYSKMTKYSESNQMLKNISQKIDTSDFHPTKIFIQGLLSYNYRMLGDSINYYKHKFHNREEALIAQKAYSETQYKDLQLKYRVKEKDALIHKKNAEQKELLLLVFGITILFLLVGLFGIYTRKKIKKLTKLLQSNNFLLSELNHRTKNNLQLIVSLAVREANKTENEGITGLTNLTSKIESIATLHQQLYQNKQLDSILLKSYIEEILTNLSPFLTQSKIEVHQEIDAVEIDANKSLYIGLLINELVVNSIKHAFQNQENKQIELSIKRVDKYLEIQYRDNGVGFSENTKVKLITTLSHQLEADFKLENRNGFCYFAKIKI